MDKYEYKIRSEEIKTLIERKKYAEAMEIADGIDWRKVRNINMLCMVSDLYKMNRKFEESREILLLAYERHPGSRMILYSLCELSIKLDDVVHAVEYYKEFVQTAPRDNGRYVLQYKLYEAQEVTLEERIAVLEELKRREYREKWAYELAYLYHRIGLSTKCVEECDELILWFGEGKYVTKAMELKMLHAPLSEEQKRKYKKLTGKTAPAATAPIIDDELDIEIKPVNVGEYATINLQKELAESMKEVLGEENAPDTAGLAAEQSFYDETGNYGYETGMQEGIPEGYGEQYAAGEHGTAGYDTVEYDAAGYDTVEYDTASIQETADDYAAAGYGGGEYGTDGYGAAGYGGEEYGTDGYGAAGYDEGEYGTGGYEAAGYGGDGYVPAGYETADYTAEGYSDPYGTTEPGQEGYETVEFDIDDVQPGQEEYVQPEAAAPVTVQERGKGLVGRKSADLNRPGEFTQEILMNMMQEDTEEMPEVPVEEELPDSEEVFFEDPDTVELPLIDESPKVIKMSGSADNTPKIMQGAIADTRPHLNYYIEPENMADLPGQETERESRNISKIADMNTGVKKIKPVFGSVMPSAESMANQKNESFDGLLSQEYDGQISLAVPGGSSVEKQITGQMSFNDILLEWEKMKKENEKKRAEAVRQRVLEQTGEIFVQFDESTKKGLFADLDAMVKEELPEVEELEEIREQTLTEEFSEETRMAAEMAAQERDGLKEEQPAEPERPIEAEAMPEGEEQAEPAESEETDLPGESDEAVEPEEEAEAVRAAEPTEPEEPEETKETKETKRAKQIKEAKKPSEAEEKPERPQRGMTQEEKKLFGSFIQTKTTKEQILDTLDRISLASCTGNVILTGDAGMGSVKLAKNIVKDVQMTDRNFSGRMAKITGQALNHKDIEKTFEKLNNGALIIEGAGDLKEGAVTSMVKLLEQEKQGIIVILEDTRINMNKLLDNFKILHQNFNLRIDIEALDNDSLVLFGKKYALEQEYAIDELGVLALYTRIAEMQTSEHSVTTKEVKEIIDEAIYHAGRMNVTHFMDVLFGKRYDDEDMIVLREKDFV